MSNEELTKYLNGINELWQMFKHYMKQDDWSSEVWTEIVDKADELIKKHGNNRMIADMALAMIGEMERVSGVMETWKNSRAS